MNARSCPTYVRMASVSTASVLSVVIVTWVTPVTSLAPLVSIWMNALSRPNLVTSCVKTQKAAIYVPVQEDTSFSLMERPAKIWTSAQPNSTTVSSSVSIPSVASLVNAQQASHSTRRHA